IARVEAARKQGLKISADMYCYTAAGTGLDACVPPWVHAGGREMFRKRLVDPALRPRIVQEIKEKRDGWENFYLGAGTPDNLLLVEFAKEHLKPFQGQTLAQMAERRKRDPVETML